MEKSKIKNIETQSNQDLWNELTDENSREGLRYNFHNALNKLINEPQLYYLESDPENHFAMVKKRAKNELVYETNLEPEVKALKMVGVEKKDQL